MKQQFFKKNYQSSQPQKNLPGFYNIEDILEKKVINNVLKYKVKWEGFPLESCTWEPFSNIQTATDKIQEFEQKWSKIFLEKQNNVEQFTPHSNSKLSKNNETSKQNGSIKMQMTKEKNEKDSSVEEVDDQQLKSQEKNAKNLQKDKQNQKYIIVKNNEKKPDSDLNQINSENESNIQQQFSNTKSGSEKFYSIEKDEVSTEQINNNHKENLCAEKNIKEDDNQEESNINSKRKNSFNNDSSQLIKKIKQDATTTTNLIDITKIQIETEIKNQSEIKAVTDGQLNKEKITKILKPILYKQQLNFMCEVTNGSQSEEKGKVILSNEFLKENYPQLVIKFYESHCKFVIKMK